MYILRFHKYLIKDFNQKIHLNLPFQVSNWSKIDFWEIASLSNRLWPENNSIHFYPLFSLFQGSFDLHIKIFSTWNFCKKIFNQDHDCIIKSLISFLFQFFLKIHQHCTLVHNHQGPCQEIELMGSKLCREIENYLILVPFSVKMRVSRTHPSKLMG